MSFKISIFYYDVWNRCMKSENKLFCFLKAETWCITCRIFTRGLKFKTSVLDYLRKTGRSGARTTHPGIFYTMGAKEDPPDPFDDIQEMHHEVQVNTVLDI